MDNSFMPKVVTRRRFLGTSSLATVAAAVLPAAVTIRSDFEAGSIGHVEQLAPYHFRCHVRGEFDQQHRNRQASWYYFAIDGAAGHEITVDLIDLPGEYNYRHGNLAINGTTRPFISYDQHTWVALPDSAIEWDQAIPQLWIRFTPKRSPVWIAHVPPYTTRDLSRLLANIKRHSNLEIVEIGKSVEGRPLFLLTVTNRARPDTNKKVLWVMARQHAWEAGTSWVMDGAIRFVLKNNPTAARLRDEFIFKLFPMADPDGVARGGVRFNVHGYDLNRNWDTVNPELMPEIAALHKAVLGWTDGGRRIDLFLNLHNTNSDYLRGPLSLAGPEYRETVDRFAGLLRKDTFFDTKEALDWPPGEIERGRMDACQDLFHERGIPTLLLEQNVQTNSRLGRPFGIEDYSRFGERLVTAMAAAVRPANKNLVPNPEFAAGPDGMPAGWMVWAPRDALRQAASVLRTPEVNMLAFKSSRSASFGKWEAVATGVRPGRTYHFEVWYRPIAARYEQVSVPVILTWCFDAAGKKMVQRDYVDRIHAYGGWRLATRTLVAPSRTQSVRVELGLRWTEKGSVLWKNPRLAEISARHHRKVRIATTHMAPPSGATVETNLALMSRILDKAGTKKPDLVLLSEHFVDRGVRQSIVETAQTIPGPATKMLSRKARQYSMYIATSLHERDGDLIFNTAVFIDRLGRIAGKYRKTHLAMCEGEDGVTPGSEYPVFSADFGKVGMLVCWDNWFPEPARILRLHGAELLLLPIAGDGSPLHWDVISRARAIDNGVYLVSSNTVGHGGASRIIDPVGNVLAETAAPFSVAFAEVDLDQEYRLHWLSVGPGDGEARSLYIRERRPDTYNPLTEP